MPNEIRIILFQLDEVSVAVKSFSPRINMNVPATMIQEVHVAPDGSPNTLLRYDGEESVIPITNNRFAASLIAYCQKIKVPLPREATKSMHVSKEHVDIRMGLPTLGCMLLSSLARDAEPEAVVQVD
jgi:hypothetical protein